MMQRFVVLLALCYPAGFAQDAGTRGSAHFGPQPGYFSLVTGAPYCGEVVSSHVQTLADGTHLTGESRVTKVCRDSLGRTSQERPRGGPDASAFVEIADPVAHVWYVLDSKAKIAHKLEWSVPERPAANAAAARQSAYRPAPRFESAAPAPDPKGPQTVSEKLEQQVMEGLQVEGRRTTTTWPEGSRMGNDRPISSVNESWRSPELQIPVLIKTFDPRSGEYTEKLTNVSRSNPDPALFQPPSDYTVVEEKDEFTIKW